MYILEPRCMIYGVLWEISEDCTRDCKGCLMIHITYEVSLYPVTAAGI